MTAAEWDQLGEHGTGEMRRDQLPLMFGALLEEATEDERRMMMAKQPWPIRVLIKVWGLGHYRRYVARVRQG